MNNIDKHKVFISFKYTENHKYKDKLIALNNQYNIFDDYSVGEGEIHDQYLTPEQIRIKIRDEWIKGASVLILLNGENMRQSNFIDWELHAAMYDGTLNKKMGILVINLPGINDGRYNSSGMVKQITQENGELITCTSNNWSYDTMLGKRPNTPKRIIKNIIKDGVSIDIINWTDLSTMGDYTMATRLKKLVDIAFDNRTSNEYDISDKLQGR